MSETAAPYEFKIYRTGIVYSSVCSSLPPEEIAARMMKELTGIASSWVFSREPRFNSTGEPNPCPCNVWPETHQHYLFSC